MKRLNECPVGTVSKISAIHGEREFQCRLMEFGFLEGAEIEVIHEAPFGRDPIAVRVRGALVALSRREAGNVEVVG